MKDNMNDVILSGINMNLSEELKGMVMEKTQKLFSHENNIIRLRVELQRSKVAEKEKKYLAKGHIEIKGNPLVATVDSADIHNSIDLLIDKLDRMIRRRSRLRKVKRKDTHSVEIPAQLPKVALA